MKLIKKIPPEDPSRSEALVAAGWQRLKEPKNVTAATMVAMPIAFILMFLNILFIFWIHPSWRGLLPEGGYSLEFVIGFNFLLKLLGIFAMLLLHELIHALFIPRFFRSDLSFMGFNGIVGFVYTEEIIGRARFLLVSVMPLLLLSFVMPLVFVGAGILSPYLIFLSILNAGGACVDVLNMLLVLRQVPRRGRIVSNGYRTFYRA